MSKVEFAVGGMLGETGRRARAAADVLNELRHSPRDCARGCGAPATVLVGQSLICRPCADRTRLEARFERARRYGVAR